MYTHTFENLTSEQVTELVDIFADRCHSWNNQTGCAKVDFKDPMEAEEFLASRETTQPGSVPG